MGLPALMTMPRPLNWPAGYTHLASSPSMNSWTFAAALSTVRSVA